MNVSYVSTATDERESTGTDSERNPLKTIRIDHDYDQTYTIFKTIKGRVRIEPGPIEECGSMIHDKEEDRAVEVTEQELKQHMYELVKQNL